MRIYKTLQIVNVYLKFGYDQFLSRQVHTLFFRVTISTEYVDIPDDPTERQDIADQLPEIVDALKLKLDGYRANMVPAVKLADVKAAKPKFSNDIWTPGWC